MKRFITLGLLVITLLCLSSCGKSHGEPLEAVNIRAMCELATLKCYYHNVAEINKKADNIFQKDRKMWIEYDGEATIGIDMTELDIEVKGEVVEITMPEAKVLSIDKEELSADNFTSSADSWFIKNKISGEDQSKAIDEAQKLMEQTASENKALLMQARENAKELIENYINQMSKATGYEYVIKWHDK